MIRERGPPKSPDAPVRTPYIHVNKSLHSKREATLPCPAALAPD